MSNRNNKPQPTQKSATKVEAPKPEPEKVEAPKTVDDGPELVPGTVIFDGADPGDETPTGMVRAAGGQLVPASDLDENKPTRNEAAEVLPQGHKPRDGQKMCEGNHSMYPNDDENFPPQAPYLGRYSRDFIESKKNVRVEQTAQPYKGRAHVIMRGGPAKQ